MDAADGHIDGKHYGTPIVVKRLSNDGTRSVLIAPSVEVGAALDAADGKLDGRYYGTQIMVACRRPDSQDRPLADRFNLSDELLQALNAAAPLEGCLIAASEEVGRALAAVDGVTDGKFFGAKIKCTREPPRGGKSAPGGAAGLLSGVLIVPDEALSSALDASDGVFDFNFHGASIIVAETAQTLLRSTAERRSSNAQGHPGGSRPLSGERRSSAPNAANYAYPRRPSLVDPANPSQSSVRQTGMAEQKARAYGGESAQGRSRFSSRPVRQLSTQGPPPPPPLPQHGQASHAEGPASLATDSSSRPVPSTVPQPWQPPGLAFEPASATLSSQEGTVVGSVSEFRRGSRRESGRGTLPTSDSVFYGDDGADDDWRNYDPGTVTSETVSGGDEAHGTFNRALASIPVQPSYDPPDTRQGQRRGSGPASSTTPQPLSAFSFPAMDGRRRTPPDLVEMFEAPLNDASEASNSYHRYDQLRSTTPPTVIQYEAPSF